MAKFFAAAAVATVLFVVNFFAAGLLTQYMLFRFAFGIEGLLGTAAILAYVAVSAFAVFALPSLGAIAAYRHFEGKERISR